jgi:hypothetical protein
VNRYRVEVVASYRLDVDLFGRFAAMPREPGTPTGIPHIETTGEGWIIEEDVSIPPRRQTLRVVYDVEGRDGREARPFALAIFAHEATRASLPEAETTVANLEP